MSRQREDILHVIQHSDRHMTAEEIYLQCREENLAVSVATVYRNLAIMTDRGLIRKISLAGEPDRYDRKIEDHDHLVCDCCKRIQDIHLDCLQRLLEKEAGVKLRSYDLCLHYVCPECRKSEETAPEP